MCGKPFEIGKDAVSLLGVHRVEGRSLKKPW
jgi:hypothetical protein